jgi:hypothetical protein
MSEDLNKEIDQIKGTEVPETKWLKEAYVGTIKIKSLIVSEEHKGADGKAYTGKPFFKFMIITRSKEDASIVFWRTTKEDTPEVARKKIEKIKKFLDNCGADNTKTGIEFLKSAIGKYVEVVMKLQEEWFTDKNDGSPRIRTKVIYSYSQKYKEPIIVNDVSQLIIKLDDKKQAEYNAAVAEYERQSGKQAPIETVKTEASPENVTETSGEDDLPF